MKTVGALHIYWLLLGYLWYKLPTSYYIDFLWHCAKVRKVLWNGLVCDRQGLIWICYALLSDFDMVYPN
jgi:hypothetical protein